MTGSFCSLTIVLMMSLIDAKPWNAEPRDAAWKGRHQHLIDVTHAYASDIKIVFLGDSITERWSTFGLEVWNEHYRNRSAYNFGVGGDRTEHVLWRIQNGELDHANPKLIVLMIGTNNIRQNDSPLDISLGISAILNRLYQMMPNSKVLLLSVLPRGKRDRDIHSDTHVDQVNSIICQFNDNKHVFYLDVTKSFRTASGQILPHLYLNDQVHLVLAGYQALYESMEDLLQQLLK